MRACVFLVLCLALPSGYASGLLKVSNGQYNPFGQAMDMMMDAMESYGRNRAWEDALSSQAWQTQPWSWGTMSGMSPWGSMPGMGTQMPGQSSMQQMFSTAPQAAQSMGGMAGQVYPQAPGGTFGFPGGGYPAMMPRPGTGTGTGTGYGHPSYGAGAVTTLEGVWQGNSGEILLVRDGHFRLYASRDNYNDGRLIVRGNRLALIDPSTGVTREYEYATQDDRLVLRDDNGNLLLYRRAPPESVRGLIR